MTNNSKFCSIKQLHFIYSWFCGLELGRGQHGWLISVFGYLGHQLECPGWLKMSETAHLGPYCLGPQFFSIMCLLESSLCCVQDGAFTSMSCTWAGKSRLGMYLWCYLSTWIAWASSQYGSLRSQTSVHQLASPKGSILRKRKWKLPILLKTIKTEATLLFYDLVSKITNHYFFFLFTRSRSLSSADTQEKGN